MTDGRDFHEYFCVVGRAFFSAATSQVAMKRCTVVSVVSGKWNIIVKTTFLSLFL